MLGVAGVELTFQAVIERLLVAPGSDPEDEGFLLDDHGRIVIRSTELGRDFSEGLHGNAAVQLDPFFVPAVVDAIGARRSGHVETNDGRLVVYQRLRRLGWYYAVVGPVPTWW